MLIASSVVSISASMLPVSVSVVWSVVAAVFIGKTLLLCANCTIIPFLFQRDYKCLGEGLANFTGLSSTYNFILSWGRFSCFELSQRWLAH